MWCQLPATTHLARRCRTLINNHLPLAQAEISGLACTVKQGYWDFLSLGLENALSRPMFLPWKSQEESGSWVISSEVCRCRICLSQLQQGAIVWWGPCSGQRWPFLLPHSRGVQGPEPSATCMRRQSFPTQLWRGILLKMIKTLW